MKTFFNTKKSQEREMSNKSNLLATIAIVALGAILFTSIAAMSLVQQKADAQSLSTRQLQLDKSQKSNGAANAVNKFVFDSINKKQGSILVQDTGGAFGNEAALIEVSNSASSGFIRVDNITLTSGQTAIGKQYSDANRATQEAINPFDFRYINITIPALGAGEISNVTVSAK